MPYTTEFVDEGTGVINVGSGIVTGLELITAAIEIHRVEERARRLTHGLTDLTDVQELRVTPDEIKRVAVENHITASLALPGAVVAIVAPRDHPFGMARMWEALVDDTSWKTHVFRTRAEANAWLREAVNVKR
jgi:hypothetical protein